MGLTFRVRKAGWVIDILGEPEGDLTMVDAKSLNRQEAISKARKVAMEQGGGTLEVHPASVDGFIETSVLKPVSVLDAPDETPPKEKFGFGGATE